MWLDASPISFTKWGKYEPKCPKGENQGCVLLGSDGREFVWSVSDCSAKAQYICKSNLTDTKGHSYLLIFLGFLSESDIVASPQTLPLGCQSFNHLREDFVSDFF